MSAAAVNREVFESAATAHILKVPPERVMKAKEVPLHYMDSNERFVLAPSESAAIHGTAGGGSGDSASSPSEPEYVDKYKTELWIDVKSHALRAQYEKARQRLLATHEGKARIYRRQEQLKAGEMSYYPGRDEWLVQWKRARTYGLPRPQQHDDYASFISGSKNEEWVRKETVRNLKAVKAMSEGGAGPN